MNSWHEKEIYITAELKLLGDEYKGGDTSVATDVVVVDTVREVDSTGYDYVLSPVNSLICLIESHGKYDVRICNFSTRELSPWFRSSLLPEEIDRNGIPCYMMKNYPKANKNYQFGFDPSTNKHKLICVWDFFSKELNRICWICEVLTIGRQGINGHNRWRRIEEVPDAPHGLAKNSVHVNGVIYWSSFEFQYGIWDSKHRPICIVAFDVGSEKFRTITVPDFILDQPGDDIGREFNPLSCPSYSATCRHHRVNFLEVSGRLAILIRMNNCMFKMYTYENDDYKLEEEMNRMPPTGGSERWSEVSSIRLPFNLGKNCGFRFCKFVGSNDEMIVTSTEGRNCGKKAVKKKCVSFYSYNWKKDSWREFEVSGLPSSVPHICTGSYVTTFSESLHPVNNDKVLF